ncbi:MAG: SGNH/GDSL hydrolase family protein [Gammaproteobacteria bacterium]|nr:SGNH/GDSL hydrolase family protein [Gammaproteobacteria bacterium]
MKQQAPPHHLTVVFMGDSITEGQYVHHSLRWAEIVSTRLKARFSDRLKPERQFYYVHGVSGETTRQGLERFPRDVQQFRPNLMTLQFGLNDCNCWDTDLGLPRVSEAAYRANLQEMIDRAKRFDARHIILSTNHPTLRVRKLASGKSLEEHRLIYNDIVRDVAHGTGVTLCDIEKVFARFDREGLEELLLPEPDVLHLSPTGHRIYADAIYEPLESAIDSLL